MEGPNQLNRLREDVQVSRDDLLQIHEGTKTEDGVRLNIRVGVQYIEAWLRGRGAVPIYNLMEDAATAEISRAQVWQWIRHGARLSGGRTVTRELVQTILKEEMDSIQNAVGNDAFASGRYDTASKLFAEIMMSDNFVEFMPSFAYDFLD
jgi:malate synthase